MSETLAKMVLRQAERFGPQAALKEKIDGSYIDITWQAMADNSASKRMIGWRLWLPIALNGFMPTSEP
jgi:long-subunit acyl-CoA synthetase (AMP-forming)